MKTNVSYTVKDWFANKVANEVKKNINMCEVFAIIKETDKAVYAMLNLGTDFHKTMWVPKSVLIENEIGEDEHGDYHYETIFADYEKAIEEFKYFWKQFK